MVFSHTDSYPWERFLNESSSIQKVEPFAATLLKFCWLFFTDHQFCFIFFPIHLFQATNIKYWNGTKRHVLLACSFSLYYSDQVTALIFPLQTPGAVSPSWFHRWTLHRRNLSNVFSIPKHFLSHKRSKVTYQIFSLVPSYLESLQSNFPSSSCEDHEKEITKQSNELTKYKTFLFVWQRRLFEWREHIWKVSPM